MITVQIEHMDAIELIKKYDTPETLFYCDPPYLASVRRSFKDYDCEIDDNYHRKLAAVLNGIQGRAAVSGYESPVYDYLYSGWIKHVAPENKVNERHTVRQEVLWTNYDPGTGARINPVPTIRQIDLSGFVTNDDQNIEEGSE